jgi:hypothetical protein
VHIQPERFVRRECELVFLGWQHKRYFALKIKNMKITYVANNTGINISTYSVGEYEYPSALLVDSINEPGNEKQTDLAEFVMFR